MVAMRQLACLSFRPSSRLPAAGTAAVADVYGNPADAYALGGMPNVIDVCRSQFVLLSSAHW